MTVLFVIARGLVLILININHFDQTISKAFLDNLPVWFIHAYIS